MTRAIALLACVACTHPQAPRAPVPHDPHSHAEPDRVRVTHVTLDLTVDFATHELGGIARLDLARSDRAADVRLDSDDLTIIAVVDCASRKPLAWHIEPTDPVIKTALVVAPADCIELAYHTGRDAGALLWVEPDGTAGGHAPMLFTQSQAIRARSWIPLQDTPVVRFTYDATIHVPDGVRPVMSAANPAAPEHGAWHFHMTQAIPSYLMALAVGDFAFREIGPRSGVYAEPSVVDAAAREFGEVEAMMTAAEQLYGPYRWDRYDMLVLPPSFPFGGMENPRLTFLTPTAITGDRALVSLIAHELAHSWSGNLVTNATWSDVWLNEGVTTYVERRIMEKLRGVEHTDIEWYLGRRDLDEAFAQTAPLDQRLGQTIGADRDPDEVPGNAAYEKGSLMLRTIEHAVGRAKLDAFLRRWFDEHAFTSTTTAVFEQAARELAFPQLARWLHDPGIPAGAMPATSQRADAIGVAAAAFARDGTQPETAGWGTLEWVLFVRALPADISRDRLQALDTRHALTMTRNAEIAMYWLVLLVHADATGAQPAIAAFLEHVGRRRMIEPLYRAMIAKSGDWRALAEQVYARAKPHYHPMVRQTLERLFQGKE